MSKGSPPAAPNYTGAAQQQGQDAQNLNAQQTYANRPDQYSPFGSTTYNANQAIDPATGRPVTQWTQQTQLNPQSQAALDSQMQLMTGRSDLAGGMLGNVQQSLGQPFDWSNLPGAGQAPSSYQMQSQLNPTTQNTTAPEFQQQTNDYINQALQRIQPAHDYQTQQLQTQLANEGLTQGSQAYNQALLQNSNNQGLDNWNAISSGNQYQQQQNQQLLAMQGQAFNQQQGAGQFYNQAAGQQQGQDLASFNAQNQARQQAIAEQQTQRGMSLNDMNALLSGQQVQNPNMPGFSTAQGGTPTQYLQAAGMQGNAAMQQYQAQVAQQQAMYGGLGALGGAAMMAFL